MTQKITSMVLSIVSCLSAFLFIFTALPVSAADDAVFVSQSVPTTMETGKTYSVWVKIKNSGTTTWSAALSYRLGAQNLQDNAKWGFNRVYLGNSDSIAPGATKTFYFAVTAPATAGTYHFQWRMVREYISWFGDYSIDKTVWVADSATVDLMARIKTKGCMGDGLLYSGYEGSKNNDDVIALVNGSGCQYVHRAIDTWPAPPDFSLIQSRMAKITKTDMAYDMFISEGISTTAVYYYPDENRNFDMAAMCVPGSASTFGASSCVPSYRSEEYRKYLRYITRKAIDLGIQSFTFGQVYMSDIDMSNPVLPMIANEIRQYGASKGRAVVVGGQTNDLADESYLRSLDYGVGGLGIDSQGNIESGSCLSTVTNFCWPQFS